MSWQVLLAVISASVGLLSGAWLCYPTAAANPHALAWAANPPYKSAQGMSELALSQSAQYFVGGLLLIAAFIMQIAAAVTPSDLPAFAYPVLFGAAGAVLFSLVIVGPSSFYVYRARKAKLERSMLAAMGHLEAHPRLTPLPARREP